MKNLLKAFACAALALISVPAVAQKDLPPPKTFVQAPCQMPGFTHQKACIVGTKIVPFTEPTWMAYVRRAEGIPLKGKQREFSIIHLYTTPNNVPSNQSVGFFASDPAVAAERGDTIMTDLTRRKAVAVWITTHDGGRTWDPIASIDLR